MILSRNFGRRAIKGSLSIFCAIVLALIFLCHPFPVNAQEISHHHKLLKNIHDEVLDFGLNKDPDLIKKEFWTDLDGNEGNKEEHIVVMRHNDGLNLKMTVQVTYFSEVKGKRYVRFAKDTKLIQCCIKEQDLEINRSDYSNEEMETLFQNILTAIRIKKENLKLIKH
jgi:hypothetical protein